MHPADVAFFKGMSSFASCALRLLFLFSLISPIHSVCSICYGSGVGCPGDSARCPWVTDVATNVASIGAAAGGAIVIAKLLPSKICRLFPKNVLLFLVPPLLWMIWEPFVILFSARGSVLCLGARWTMLVLRRSASGPCHVATSRIGMVIMC